jgi:NADH:ubiquinone oxidoreductase subunit 6 (subunit J)
MVFSPGTTLRWLAATTLFSSVAMVATGEFLLKERLHAEVFIYYWMVCIAFTFLTMMLALADFWIVRRRMHRQQRVLLAEALEAVVQAGGLIEEQEWHKRDF